MRSQSSRARRPLAFGAPINTNVPVMVAAAHIVAFHQTTLGQIPLDTLFRYMHSPAAAAFAGEAVTHAHWSILYTDDSAMAIDTLSQDLAYCYTTSSAIERLAADVMRCFHATESKDARIAFNAAVAKTRKNADALRYREAMSYMMAPQNDQCS